MEVETLAQLRELDLLPVMTIVTVTELPRFTELRGARRWTNRFIACQLCSIDEDGEIVILGRSGQPWARIRDVA